MDKEELLKILNSLNINYDEGIQNIDSNIYPRLVFWDYVWEPLIASGKSYDTCVTYQLSWFSLDEPRKNKDLFNFLNKIKDYNLNPIIYHEYNQEQREWHSYFSLEIMEKLLCQT